MPAHSRSRQLQGIILIDVTAWGHPDDRRPSHDAVFEHQFVKPVTTDILMQLHR